MEYMHACISNGDGVGKHARAVGRVIIHHKHVNVTRLRTQREHQAHKILAFIVGGHNDQSLARPNACRGLGSKRSFFRGSVGNWQHKPYDYR